MSSMLVGSVVVPDVGNPRPEDVDIAFMRQRLMQVRRFLGHPAALSVYDHQRLCGKIARAMGMPAAVVLWAQHHDDHEYVTGDIPRPLQRVIAAGFLRTLQERWDVAICGALGIPLPTPAVRSQVAVVDDVALALEWMHCIGRDFAEVGVDDDIRGLAARYAHLMLEFAP